MQGWLADIVNDALWLWSALAGMVWIAYALLFALCIHGALTGRRIQRAAFNAPPGLRLALYAGVWIALARALAQRGADPGSAFVLGGLPLLPLALLHIACWRLTIPPPKTRCT